MNFLTKKITNKIINNIIEQIPYLLDTIVRTIEEEINYQRRIRSNPSTPSLSNQHDMFKTKKKK